MFEAAESGRTVGKAEYEAEVARLRWELLDLQRRLRLAPFPLVVLLAGTDGAGRSETAHLLNEWMDPRWIVNRAFDEPSPDERERPPFWRYWMALPPRGQIGLFMTDWYSPELSARVARRQSSADFDVALDRIAAFERTLADDGAVIRKFWLHLSRRRQGRRLEALAADPLTSWRVTGEQWKQHRRYGRWREAAEHMVRRTSEGHAPWTIVDAADERYRMLAIATELRDTLSRALAGVPEAGRRRRRGTSSPPGGGVAASVVARADHERSVLDRVDMSAALSKPAARRALLSAQGRLNRLQRRARLAGRSLVLVFEGWDAAGKGGAIRRVTAALPPQSYRVIPVGAPSDEERAQHYLWRFWRHLSRAGQVTIFDRSWYGRVLVERVEGLATPAEWSRAYAEIRHFEEALTAHGTVVVKYWLHITKDEQERRFRERAASPYKSWKLTDEDWRNRAQWDAYELAVNEMVEQTSTRESRWHLVAANDKARARVEVVRLACRALARALD